MQLGKFKKQVRRILRKIHLPHKNKKNSRELRVGDLVTFVCKDHRISKVPLNALICNVSNFSYEALVRGEIHTFGKEFYDVVQSVQDKRDSYNSEKPSSKVKG